MNLSELLISQQKNIDDLLTQEMSLLILGYLSKKEDDFSEILTYFWQEIHKNTADLIKNVITQLPEYQHLAQNPDTEQEFNQIIAQAVEMRIKLAKNVVNDWKNRF